MLPDTVPVMNVLMKMGCGSASRSMPYVVRLMPSPPSSSGMVPPR